MLHVNFTLSRTMAIPLHSSHGDFQFYTKHLNYMAIAVARDFTISMRAIYYNFNISRLLILIYVVVGNGASMLPSIPFLPSLICFIHYRWAYSGGACLCFLSYLYRQLHPIFKSNLILFSRLSFPLYLPLSLLIIYYWPYFI